MALTKIGKEGITGISNSSDATAITITSAENVGIGTTNAAHKLNLQVNAFVHLGYNGTAANTETGRISSNSYAVNNDSYSLAEMSFVTSAANGYTGIIQFRTNSVNSTNSRAAVRMTIDATGAVTMPSQPAFNVYPASEQSNIAINTAVTVVFGTEAFDQGADFASNTFTAPVTGKYQLNVHLQLNALDTASDLYQLQIITSNKSYNLTLAPKFASDPTYYGITNSILADMDANDTVLIKIYQAGGTAQTDIVSDSNFSGYLVA